MKDASSAAFPIFLTSKQVASILNTTTRNIHYLVKKKKGPPAIKLGMQFQFKKDEFMKWLDARKVR